MRGVFGGPEVGGLDGGDFWCERERMFMFEREPMPMIFDFTTGRTEIDLERGLVVVGRETSGCSGLIGGDEGEQKSASMVRL